MAFPRISSYGQYSSQNYGMNCLCVEIGTLTVWYSYETPVAFQVAGNDIVVSENLWGPTTGKHLNWIADKKERVPRKKFEEMWKNHAEPLVK